LYVTDSTEVLKITSNASRLLEIFPDYINFNSFNDGLGTEMFNAVL